MRGPDDLDGAFAATMHAGADALYVVALRKTVLSIPRIVHFAAKNRLPGRRLGCLGEAGGLLSYGPNTGEIVRHAASYVDKILKGEKLGDLAVQQPVRFELLINLKAAKALGLALPESLLLRADRVIE